VLPSQAFLLAGFVCVPPIMYLLYRSIVPYEDAMHDPKLGGALFYPAILGFAIGLAHLMLDVDLILGGFGVVAFLGLYPAIETYAIVVVFNRDFFARQPASPLYFGIGGGALALGLAFLETFRSMADPAFAPTDAPRILTMLALASAFVLLHTSKGLLVGTYFAGGGRARGLAAATLLQVPFGALAFTYRIGVAPGEMVGAMAVYGAVVYVAVWHVFFPKRMPQELAAEIERGRRKARRRAIARRQK